MSFLQTNLASLSTRFPDLAARIAEAEEYPLQATRAASGEVTARLPGGALVHSSRDPRSEAERLARALLGEGADSVVLPGFGLGYLAEACVSAGAERVIVCEPSVASLKAAFGLRDLSSLLKDERLILAIGGGPDAAVSALELSGASVAVVAEPRAAAEMDRAWLHAARDLCERWIAASRVNERTLKRFGRLWVRNLAANLGLWASSCGVERLAGLFSEMPAIVLAAGPSLDDILPRLGEIRRRALVVSVDTALRSVLRFGLEPDFLVIADPQYWNWRHIAGLQAPSAFIVSDPTTWPAAFRMTCRGVFLSASLFPLGRRIESFAGCKGRLGAGGSVSTSAWDFARLCGASPIWMAGLDLGFPGGATHARASLFEQRALAAGSRLEPAETAQASALVGSECFEGRSAEGGRLRSDRRMELYAWWFESRLARPDSPPTYSLSPRGLAIPGMPVKAVEELLDGPDIRITLDERLAQAASFKPPEGAPESLREGVAALRADLAEVQAAAESAARAARLGGEALNSGGDVGAVLAALDESDRRILSLDARDVAGFLLPPLSEIARRRSGSLAESLRHSEELYREVADSAKYHLDILKLV